jgi:Apea-like HEPN
MTRRPELAPSLETWYVLVCGLPLAGDSFNLGSSLGLRRLLAPLSVFDLAAVGAVGFREWAVLEPLAASATAEIASPTSAATLPGYDALNKCWLASALLVIRGFARHICPAVSAYSWNFVAGHQKASATTLHRQVVEEGVEKAVFEPRMSLPKFQGGLLEYHLRLLIPKETRSTPFDSDEAAWISTNFERFNQLAAENERFRFALEAAIDWRYAKDPRAALARVWAGIESLLGISSELVYRVSLSAATIVAARGPERVAAFKKIKSLYGVRSKAVHGEPITEDRLFSGLHDSFDVLRTMLLDAVERGAVRAEDDLSLELLA